MIIKEYSASINDNQPQTRVQLDMSRVSAVALLHDVNRLLTCIDDSLHGRSRMVRDLEAYDRVNAFVDQLRRDLLIRREETEER